MSSNDPYPVEYDPANLPDHVMCRLPQPCSTPCGGEKYLECKDIADRERADDWFEASFDREY